MKLSETGSEIPKDALHLSDETILAQLLSEIQVSVVSLRLLIEISSPED